MLCAWVLGTVVRSFDFGIASSYLNMMTEDEIRPQTAQDQVSKRVNSISDVFGTGTQFGLRASWVSLLPASVVCRLGHGCDRVCLCNDGKFGPEDV